ncbi:conserved hypothetical protein [Talaromyces marneffei ATCC 18224]|uniref:Rhodopsin domain-containing protein n=1 Tax=Talaromyces marneffei (strain ATCC 18224 / CBS 334.59 / QM 7333) TaxID=441960 RepID=B6QM67_TALMQ|nr:conserved hypothetical protein [Talaromyces marneffei ATCC 18224]
MYEIKPDQILASAYTMIVLTGIAIVSRFFLRGLRNEAFRLEDGFMLFAFVTFNILSTITIVVVPIAYQIVAVSYDLKPLYNGLFDDEEYQLRVVFASNLLFPMVLWSVKVSLLLLSRRLMYQYREWIRAWWVVLGFVALTYLGNWISILSSCTRLEGYFRPGGCNTDRDAKAQMANLYYVVVTEIITDGLIMALPIMFLHQANLTRTTYYRTAAIFSVGVICIVVALVRGITIGTRLSVNTPTLPWILIWEMIEGGIAVIVGCLPAYAVYFIQATKRPGTTQQTGSALYEPRTVEVGNQDNIITRITTRLPASFKRFTCTQYEDGNLTSGIRQTRKIEVTTHSAEEEGHPVPAVPTERAFPHCNIL